MTSREKLLTATWSAPKADVHLCGLDKITSDYIALQKQKEALTSDLNLRTAERDDERAKVVKLKGQYQHAINTLAAANEEKANQNTALKELSNEVESIKIFLKDLQTIADSYMESCSIATEQAKELNDFKDDLFKKFESARRDIMESSTRVQTVDEALESLSQDVQGLAITMLSIEDLQQRIVHLQSKLDENKQAQEVTDGAYQKESALLKASIHEAEDQLTALRRQCQTSEATVQKREQEVRSLSKELAKSQTDLDSAHEKIHRLKEEGTSARQEISALQEKLQKAENGRELAIQSKAKHADEFQKLRCHSDELQKELNLIVKKHADSLQGFLRTLGHPKLEKYRECGAGGSGDEPEWEAIKEQVETQMLHLISLLERGNAFVVPSSNQTPEAFKTPDKNNVDLSQVQLTDLFGTLGNKDAYRVEKNEAPEVPKAQHKRNLHFRVREEEEAAHTDLFRHPSGVFGQPQARKTQSHQRSSILRDPVPQSHLAFSKPPINCSAESIHANTNPSLAILRRHPRSNQSRSEAEVPGAQCNTKTNASRRPRIGAHTRCTRTKKQSSKAKAQTKPAASHQDDDIYHMVV
eukprot:Clim_evm39s218 gene=Clim_evmTU39s218